MTMELSNQQTQVLRGDAGSQAQCDITVEQYDTLSDVEITELAKRAMQNYAADYQGELYLLCRSENATFKIVTADKQYALRIHRPNYHDKISIESELAWLSALTEQGIVSPTPIASRDGSRVQTLLVSEHEQRHAVLFDWIDGTTPTTDVDPKAYQALGTIMARLHMQSIQWHKPNDFKRLVWSHDNMVGKRGYWGAWSAVAGLNDQDRELIERVLNIVQRQLTYYGKAPDRYGLIHADLRLTNLLMHQEGTRVIDFDDCGIGWFMHDAAAAISFYEHHPLRDEWLNNWLIGYQSVRALTAHDIAILPVMIIQRRIQLLAWIGSHSETEMAQSLGENWVKETVRLCREFLEQECSELPLAV
ncbi:phosphotransferase enzyme family protein [Vibrio tritonius]|uniref:phosphotransferase enzyme family protein n=1 Tax=Vibrio tritonius TaxID=1435069 RepID=UPI000AEF8D09|nr:phosphotransferase [Vibrio tritonius]